jgi:hypothetical protein
VEWIASETTHRHDLDFAAFRLQKGQHSQQYANVQGTEVEPLWISADHQLGAACHRYGGEVAELPERRPSKGAIRQC